jgi:hypothetical protein
LVLAAGQNLSLHTGLVSGAEKSFFEEILSFESQGWRVAIPEGAAPGALNLSDLSINVYVVDVPGGQFWRSAISPAEFENTLAHCDAQGSTNSARVIAPVRRTERTPRPRLLNLRLQESARLGAPRPNNEK